MVSINKNKYYDGYFDTYNINPTIRILYQTNLDIESIKSVEELAKIIREQAKNNVDKWIEMNCNSQKLFKSQLIYVLNNTYKQFMLNKKLGCYNGEIKKYIDTDRALALLDITFTTKIFKRGVDEFAESTVELGVDAIRKMLETISMLHIIDKLEYN